MRRRHLLDYLGGSEGCPPLPDGALWEVHAHLYPTKAQRTALLITRTLITMHVPVLRKLQVLPVPVDRL